MQFKAVIFDIGVCVGSPMRGIHRFEQENGLPRNYINVAIVQQGEHGAFQQLERGEIKLHDFYKAFGDQLSHPSNKAHYKAYLEKAGKPVPEHIPDVVVDGKELFRTMMIETSIIDQRVFKAIQRLKENKQLTIAALTNNFELPEHDLEETKALGNSVPESLRSQFDYFIESRLVGLRKPDPKFFSYACDLIGVAPNEAIFLDDIGMNLRAAKKLGMTTIQVKLGKSAEAIQQLEALVNMDLQSGAAKL
ncbi:HAD-like domain-containing protein [Radiomyces spectabilis]|uniref:HAD-like domain-containing protein n=1 Tax=Radiomyces spectabilis TaxID=64574 RepID=UPI00221EF1C7|nr:HAD-like domain-containing protein [Radiomyces spectabilis]KAI8367512.1 HAD-like domain-containing protein [Radiomyces spectabilis]